eukprot:1160179-Pelagomonas_calceolata.AAC.12
MEIGMGPCRQRGRCARLGMGPCKQKGQLVRQRGLLVRCRRAERGCWLPRHAYRNPRGELVRFGREHHREPGRVEVRLSEGAHKLPQSQMPGPGGAGQRAAWEARAAMVL